MQCFQKSYFHLMSQHCNTFFCASHATSGGQAMQILVFCRFPKIPQIMEAAGAPCQPPAGAHESSLPRQEPSGSPRESCHGTARSAGGVPSCPAVPALGPRSSGQHKAAAVQERIWLSSLWQEHTLGSFSSHRSRQTRLCSLAHKRVFILPSAGRLSPRRPPLGFPSPPAGEKTRELKPRTRELQFGCWYCLIVWPQSFNLSVPSSLPGKAQGSWVCLGRTALPRKRTGYLGEQRHQGSLSLGQPAAARDGAKCKGQSHPVTRGVLLLIFNLREPFS